jgi:hypothetical protein
MTAQEATALAAYITSKPHWMAHPVKARAHPDNRPH